jgi:hypothetical protein
MRLLINDTKSPKVKKTIQTTFIMKSGAMGLILEVYLILPCLVLLVLRSIRPYGDHYKKENGHAYNDTIKI